MPPRPPGATLFPYTTLFRSRIAQRAYEPYEQRGGQAGSELEDWLQAERDRKSTRLNSSHVTISYAPFSLKKKSIPTTPTHPATASLLLPTTSPATTASRPSR